MAAHPGKAGVRSSFFVRLASSGAAPRATQAVPGAHEAELRVLLKAGWCLAPLRGTWRAPFAPVAQLDRAVAFEATGRGFESLRAREDPSGFGRARGESHGP
jgi:hypothetical protein